MHRRTRGAGQLSRNRCRTYCNRGIIFITVVCLFCARNRFLRSSPVPAVDTTLPACLFYFHIITLDFVRFPARQLSIFVIIIISNYNYPKITTPVNSHLEANFSELSTSSHDDPRIDFEHKKLKSK